MIAGREREKLPDRLGRLITFYSYKGGTGRTLAVANVGCFLAMRAPRPVLLVDADLEAPGLTTYFPNASAEGDTELGGMGTMDLFESYSELLDEGPTEVGEVNSLEGLLHRPGLVAHSGFPNLHLMSAGELGDGYGERVASFSFAELYESSPSGVVALADVLKRQYSYILVDARTGVSDVTGLLTAVLPDSLVLVHTPNRQSLDGALRVGNYATNWRRP